MSFLFHEFLYKPLFNLLIFLYETISFGDLGVAIILLTILVRLAFFPLSQKAVKSQKELFKIQPKIREIQQKYKDDKERQAREIMNLYKTSGVNPLSGCLPILIQIPILIALYWVFLKGFNGGALVESDFYSFTPKPESINYTAFGFLDLSKNNVYVAFIAALFQYLQSRMMFKQQMKAKKEVRKEEILHDKNKAGKFIDEMSTVMSKQMMYFVPFLTFVVSASLHAGIALYWAVTTLFSLVQQWYVFRKEK